jgi:prepilin-type N-terminal cleavage/methylation domain-containing protein
MNKYMEKREEQGFTLIELLIAIVVVGILAAVAIVGIAGLTDTGGQSACKASADAAKAASAAFYANNSNTWPATLNALATDTPDVYEEPSGAVFAGAGPSTMKVGTWTLTQTGGGASQPTFACS